FDMMETIFLKKGSGPKPGTVQVGSCLNLDVAVASRLRKSSATSNVIGPYVANGRHTGSVLPCGRVRVTMT
ncbi:hypothetical protein, partial [Nocardia thraciensis]